VELLAKRAWPFVAPVGLGIAVLWLLVPAAVRGGDLPTPQSPPVGASCDESRVRLVWQASVGAGPYQIEVAEAAGFDRIVWRGSSQTTTVTLPPLRAGRRFHWRVRRGEIVGPPSEFETAPDPVPY